FQAEDGIRDRNVTGVQTCALPIYFINDMIKKRDIEHIEGGLHDNDGHLIVRETFREAPHNMYLQFGAVDEVAEEKGYDITEEYEPLPFLDKDSLPEDLPY